MRTRLGFKQPMVMVPKSAEELALSLTPEELYRLHESNQEMEDALGLRLDAHIHGPKGLQGP